MTEFIPTEKGVTIRFPSSANFLISSTDRAGFPNPTQSAADFLINKPQALLNGFFTRIAPTEVVLDWCVDNISNALWGNSFLGLDLSGAGGPPNFSINLAAGEYTVQQCLDSLVAVFNAAPPQAGGQPFVLSLTTGVTGLKQLHMDLSGTGAVNFVVRSVTPGGFPIRLASQLSLAQNVAGNDFPVDCPLLLPTRWIDFTSSQLTYNQDLKDAATAQKVVDILFRWYLAWDTPEPLDGYGYPIYQGYKRFVQRRPIAFPKQIRWDNIQPIGQVAFQLYDDNNELLDLPATIGELEWQMTCLVSEV